MQLSRQQKNAVEYIGAPTLVIAGAGSGKTRTLTAKIRYLISQGYDPEAILAITFTNKAADEMKHRLTMMTGMPLHKFPWVRTYHSACFRILKTHCTLLGYAPQLQIYTTYQQEKILKEIIIGLNFDKKYVPAVMSRISHAKNSGNPGAYFDHHRHVSRIPLANVFQLYEKALRTANAVDFDNILLMTRDLLREHKAVRSQYQYFFQYILVDEYQDTNNLQEELTRLLLKNGNLFCVGDDWQAIYGFRGSNLNHFLSFPRTYENAKIFRLEQNYRSADEIVKIANRLIDHNARKMDKTCFSQKHGGIIELCGFGDEGEEARWTAKKIKSLERMGIPYGRMAVLYRTKFCSLAFEKAFRAYSIPYQMMGSKGFFERKEILDINCYLKSAVFAKDDVSFERILNIPRRGIGPRMFEKIRQVRTDGMGLQDSVRKILTEKILSPKIHHTLKHLIQMLDAIRIMEPEPAIRKLLAETSYMEYLRQYSKSNNTDYDTREENIKELLWSASKHQTLLEYLEEVDLVQEDREEDDEAGNNTGVKLSTIHASKGLEYAVVFVAGCEEGLFPHWKSESPSEMQEERRLMYVAITRAEQYLFLSYAKFRRGQTARKSRFWKEIRNALE